MALSSITNRVTGVALTGAMSAGGVIALVGGPEAVPMTIEMFKAHAPFAVMPAKFALSFPFVSATLGGFRHLVWDTTTKGIDNEEREHELFGDFQRERGGERGVGGVHVVERTRHTFCLICLVL